MLKTPTGDQDSQHQESIEFYRVLTNKCNQNPRSNGFLYMKNNDTRGKSNVNKIPNWENFKLLLNSVCGMEQNTINKAVKAIRD